MYKNSLCDVRVSFGVLFALLLFVLSVPSLLAQTSSTAALTGTVTDPTGAVIANATVTATNTGNGQVRTTTTGSDGVYRFNLLPTGTYSVKFEAGGFETSEVSSVELNVTETPVLNRSLTVGSQSQQVTVEAETEAIQTASSALGTVVSSQSVTDIPLSTRNYLNLIAMSAGANAAVNNASQPGKGGINLFVNGSNSGQNNFQMDGSITDNYYSTGNGTDSGFYAAIPVPNPDVIQEFKIQTSSYDAGYGRNPGANVNVVTKGGTNAFHGNAFEFFRNRVLNANDWFIKRNQLGNLVNGVLSPLPNKQPLLNQNQYGGTFGGPIKKDKLFFFVSYQETSQKNAIANLQTAILPPIPGTNSSSTYNRGTCSTPNWTNISTQCDAATVSFVTALATAISPTCPGNGSISGDKTSATVGGIQIACPGATVASGTNTFNINPVAINLLQLKLANGAYYIPTSTAGPYAVNTFSNNPDLYTEHQAVGNFDYTIDSKNTLSERFIYSTNPTTAPFGCGNGGAGDCVPGGPVIYQYWQRGGTLKLTSIATNNLVNEARVAFQRFDSHTKNLVPFTASQVGITPLSPSIDTLPQFDVIGSAAGSGFQLGGEVLFGLDLVVQQVEFGDQVSWTHGKHSLRFGGEFEHDNTTINFHGLHFGNPQFPSFPDFLIGRAACNFTGCSTSNPGNTNGGTLASNETGVGTAILSSNNDQLESVLPVDAISLFVQDDFKLNSRLTLNLGLRWEWFGHAKTLGGAWSDTWTSLLAQQPISGTGCVVNGVTIGIPGGGTGCSLVGFEAPSNFPGAVPAGVYTNNSPFLERQGPKMTNFAPRVGFAWQPLSNNNRLVVRGGAGFFYDRPNGLLETELGHSNPPFAFGVAPSAQATLANPFVVSPLIPGPAGTPGWTPRWAYLNSSGTAVTSNISGTNTVSEDFSNGVVYEWNLNTQYEFLPTWVLELGYVGSRGIQLPGSANLTGTAAAYNMVPANMAQLATAGNPVNCNYDGKGSCITTTTTANREIRVPFLGFSSQLVPATSTDQTKFNSLQATVRKQLSHGLTLQAAYTWSRSFINYYTGNPAATQPGIAPYYDPYFPNINYRPQRLVFNYSWAIPSNREGILGRVLNGWTWSGVTVIQDGTPLFITDTRDGSAFVAPGFGPDALATWNGTTPVATNGSVDSRVVSGLTGGAGYLNKMAFSAPQPVGGGTATGYGNYNIGKILGPPQDDWDMTLSKDIKIKESQSLQFRTEFFNAFNHPQFSNPGANVGAVTGFGQITSTSVNPRLIQFALKYSF